MTFPPLDRRGEPGRIRPADRNRQYTSRKRAAVTICAAILCKLDQERKQDAVFCIADRMITWGDKLQSETQHQTKMWALGNTNAVALCAGDPDEHDVIIAQTHQELDKLGLTDVPTAASLYRRYLREYERREREERKECGDEEEIDGVDIIIAGFDSGGAHIYTIRSPGKMHREDNVGFCAVGSGETEFRHHFKRRGYDRFWNVHDALFLLYAAKKKAEAIQGVGKEITDIFQLNQDIKKSHSVPDTVKALDEYYEDFEKTLAEKRTSLVEQMKKDFRILCD